MDTRSRKGQLNISPKRNLMEKKMIFYPEMAKVSKEDEFLYTFLKKDFGCPFQGKSTDPDKVDFKAPDFGFDNYLVFDHDEVAEKKNQ